MPYYSQIWMPCNFHWMPYKSQRQQSFDNPTYFARLFQPLSGIPATQKNIYKIRNLCKIMQQKVLYGLYGNPFGYGCQNQSTEARAMITTLHFDSLVSLAPFQICSFYLKELRQQPASKYVAI